MKKKFFQRNATRLFGCSLALAGAMAMFATGNVKPSVKAKAEESGVPTVASLFTAADGAVITTNVDTPSYVKEMANGVHVSSPTAGKVYYNNVIDMTDMTQASTLFEVQITPNAVGVSEFNQLLIRLEDVEDPKSFVEISFCRYYYGDSALDRITHVSVRPDSVDIFNGRYYRSNTQTIVDPETGATTYKHSPDYYMRDGIRQATMVRGPFAGSKGGWSNSLKFYYNDVEKMIYTKDASSWTPDLPEGQALINAGLADKNGIIPVLDMDNAGDMGVNKTAIWDGFPSGKAKLSIQTNDLLTEGNANYMILQIDGQRFDGEYLNDVTAPELSVDLLGYNKNQLPKAVVGKEYSFFPATAVDKMYGDLNVKKNVYKDGELIYTTGDGFVPDTTGDYVVEFVASDGNRNETKQSFTITAVADPNAIVGTLNVKDAIDLNDANARNIPLYYPVTLPTMDTTGGNGTVAVKTEVFYNGKQQTVTKNVFTPNAPGDYTVKYTLTDYVGNVKTYEYVLSATFSEDPRLIDPVLPDYLTAGQATILPKVNSELYTVWKQKVATYDKIYVYKADGETLLGEFDGSKEAVFTPPTDCGDTILVVYTTAKDQSSEPVVYYKEISLVKPDKLSNKFIMDSGVEMEMSDEGDAFNFIFTEDGQSVEFIGKVSIFGGLLLEFNVPKGMNAYDGVSFTIVDAYDADNYIVVTFYKNPNPTARTSEVSVNDGVRGEFPASFHGNRSDYFVFTVSQYGEIYNYNEDIVAKAENFKGFESGYVYVTMTVMNARPNFLIPAVVSWVSIKNQNFNEVSEYEDFVDPVLSILEEPIGIANLGDKLYVSAASACDIFTEAVTLSVTVAFGDDVIFTHTDDFGRFDGATFYATNYGSYTITYTAVDKVGNDTSKTYTVVVRDTKAPTLTIDDEMPTTWKKGKTFSFPTVTAEDNVDLDVEVYVIIINPVNVYTVLREGDTYKPTMSGRYIVKFYCQDARYNSSYSQEYEIIVQ